MKKRIFLIIAIFLLSTKAVNAQARFFKIQSIDTMKFSRDMARSTLTNPGFDREIELQMKNISLTGATHVAVDTPYDEEFVPVLTRWVNMARKYKLHVWFRGNFSGWENWFDYPKIDRQTHLQDTKSFILNHPNLFQDGDVFTACPECENGGPGDPRQTGDVKGFRSFMIDEYHAEKEAFNQIHKNVQANFDSMNGDVARLVMDDPTIQAMDNVITIDHYVKTPEDYTRDLVNLAKRNKGNVHLVIGEFGAPIPDLQGKLSQKDQAAWINKTLKNIVAVPHVIAINYWTDKQSTTELWNDDDTKRLAVTTISQYYQPLTITGSVTDERGNTLEGVIVQGKNRITQTVKGTYELPIFRNESIYFHKPGYISVSINAIGENESNIIDRDVVLYTQHGFGINSILGRITVFIKQLFIRQ